MHRVLWGMLMLAIFFAVWVGWDYAYPQLGPKTTATCDITRATTSIHHGGHGSSITQFDYETQQCGKLWTRSSRIDTLVHGALTSNRITYSTAPGKRGEVLDVVMVPLPATP